MIRLNNENRKKMALVYDKAVTWGGAERVLLNMHKIYPNVDFYTSIFNLSLAPWVSVFNKVYSSHINFSLFQHKYFLATPLMSWSFEQFNFSAYDIVLTVTSYSAKSVITNSKTCHICYCLTPDRYLWFENKLNFESDSFLSRIPKLIYRLTRPIRQVNDQYRSTRPDYYIAISQKVSRRITKYYNRESIVVYPGVNTDKFTLSHDKSIKRGYYLLVGRMTPYKMMDVIIKVFNSNRKQLIVVGGGYQSRYLQSIASENIQFKNYVSDSELVKLYQNAKALIAIQEEDFGLVALESLACGTPVIVNKKSGVAEILDEQSSLFVNSATADDLDTAVELMESMNISPKVCRNIATKYNEKYFMKNFSSAVNTLYKKYTSE